MQPAGSPTLSKDVVLNIGLSNNTTEPAPKRTANRRASVSQALSFLNSDDKCVPACTLHASRAASFSLRP